MAEAESLYQQAAASEPHNPDAIASLARTQLRLGAVGTAAATVRPALADSPKSVPLLTELAEVQLREGQPWLGRETLHTAELLDPCYARIFLVGSRIDRVDSMYASQRAELARAHAIEPDDVEIKRAWNQTVTPANDIASTEEYLATTKEIEPEQRKSAESSMRRMLPLLSESSQTCQVLPQLEAAVLPLQPSMQDGRAVDGYRLEVALPKGKVSLGLDTAASGVYLSRAVAQANGFEYRLGDPSGTVRADSLQIGPLTFHDCLIGVSDTPFPGKGAGMIGTDLFGSYLVTLNFPAAKLELGRLPLSRNMVPGDRVISEEMRGFTPVYHRQQFLMVPVTLNGKERRLFALDSGMRMSTMTLPVAHMVSSTQHNFTNPMKTTSGAVFQVYRDSFDFEFANRMLRNRTGVLQFDPTAVEQRTGMEIGGVVGFDMLHAAVLQLDYRDGLVKLDFPNGEGSATPGDAPQRTRNPSQAAEEEARGDAVCEQTMAAELPNDATIKTKSTGLWDAARMKPGDAITVKLVQDFVTPECRMSTGSLLYGRITAGGKAPAGGQARLGVVFERAECEGKGKEALPLKLVSVVAAPNSFVGLHTQIPVSIGGGSGRQISDTLSALTPGEDYNLNPEKTARTVQTGSVQGIPDLHLDMVGGPKCSALLTDTAGYLRLQPETRFLLVLPQMPSR